MADHERTVHPVGPADPEASWDTEAPSGESSLPRQAEQPSPPGWVGPYHIERLLGAGGMGRVYAARDTRLHRQVALKQIAQVEGESPEARARFWREARALAALRHPGVVTVYDIGEASGGALYIAMEFIAGRPVSRLLRARWPVPVALEVGRQLAEALGAAHRVGLVHRDVKPSNLILEEGGSLRVIDFGLARRSGGSGDSVTHTGGVMGTPAWMSPEQLRGDAVGPQSDVFAVGVLLYRLLSGAHPFARDSSSATALALAGAVHTPLSVAQGELPGQLAAVVERCLALNPADRYPNGGELAVELSRVAAAMGLSAGPEALREFVGHPERHEPDAATPGSEPSLALKPMARQVAPAVTQPASSRRWLLLAAAGLTLALLVGAALWGGASRGLTGAGAAGPGGHAALVLPPRPVVAVLGLNATDHSQNHQMLADVASDAMRELLMLDPEAVVSMPLTTLLSTGLDMQGAVVREGASLRPLVREGQRRGRVDVVVDGELDVDGDQALVRLVLRDPTSGAAMRKIELSGEAGDPVGLALAATSQLMPLLGGQLPERLPRLQTEPDAWAAYLQAVVATLNSDSGAARSAMDLADQRDSSFVLTPMMRLHLLRAERRNEELRAEAQRLVALGEDLPPVHQAMAQVWLSMAEDDRLSMVRQLNALLQRWPLHADAWELLMACLFADGPSRDLQQAQKVALQVLAMAPQSLGAASRLVRSLAFRGQAAQAQGVLRDAGFDGKSIAAAEIYGELALYLGDYDEALAQFSRVINGSDEAIYSEHMSMAALILSGQCKRAAVLALERIDLIEGLGRSSNLDWTYSLASQALICMQRFEQVDALLARWAPTSDSGSDQSLVMSVRLKLLRGATPAQVAERAVALLESGALHTNAEPNALLVLARVCEDLDTLARWRERAQHEALDTSHGTESRAAFLRADDALGAKELLLRGDPGARAAYEALVLDLDQCRSEGDHISRALLLASRAEALLRLGDTAAAREDWQQIRAMGYTRLWVTDVWVQAGVELEAAP